jgi:hypothetical protein
LVAAQALFRGNELFPLRRQCRFVEIDDMLNQG